MTTDVRQLRPSRRAFLVPLALVAMLALVLAACGGGNNGGNGGGGTLKVAFVNETESEATISLDDGEGTTVESCKGGVFSYSLPDGDWIVYVNDQPAIDSIEVDQAILGGNMAAQLWLREDGSLELESIQRGSNIQAPPAFSICT